MEGKENLWSSFFLLITQFRLPVTQLTDSSIYYPACFDTSYLSAIEAARQVPYLLAIFQWQIIAACLAQINRIDLNEFYEKFPPLQYLVQH